MTNCYDDCNMLRSGSGRRKNVIRDQSDVLYCSLLQQLHHIEVINSAISAIHGLVGVLISLC